MIFSSLYKCIRSVLHQPYIATTPSNDTNMSTPPPFAYTALSSPTNIRLLWIEPGSDEDPIALSLFEALSSRSATANADKELREALQDAVQLSAQASHGASLTELLTMFWKYEALSYVWGEEKDKLKIMLDNKPFKVTRNLQDFLLQMRPKCSASSVRAGPFWIDAISINQTDNKEKGAQVNMMGDIYRNCERCIVWMGKEKDDSALAFDLMKAVEDYTCYLHADGFGRGLSWKGSHLENRGKIVLSQEGDPLVALSEKLGFHNGRVRRVPSPDSLEERLFKYPMWHRKSQISPLFLHTATWAPISSPKAWEALLRLFKREYFFRIWTKQESILPAEILWRCGSQFCDRTTNRSEERRVGKECPV